MTISTISPQLRKVAAAAAVGVGILTGVVAGGASVGTAGATTCTTRSYGPDGRRTVCTDGPAYHVKGVGSGALRVRVGPSADSQAVDNLREGTLVHVQCQVESSPLPGNGDRIWDRLGPNRWVTDWYLDTPAVGRFTPGLPRCDEQAPQPPAPNPGAEQAVSRALAAVGRTDLEWKCDYFVAFAWGHRASGERTAWVHFQDLRNRGLIHADGTPPPGALAFFSAAPVNGGAGHVMVSLGDGRYVSTNVHGAVRVTGIGYFQSGGVRYLGWAQGSNGFPNGV